MIYDVVKCRALLIAFFMLYYTLVTQQVIAWQEITVREGQLCETLCRIGKGIILRDYGEKAV